MLNNVTLRGRMASDVLLRKSNTNAKSVTNFTLICERDDHASSIDRISCIAWGRNAEIICDYCAKGKLITIVGRIESRERKNDKGDVEYIQEVNVQHIYLN